MWLPSSTKWRALENRVPKRALASFSWQTPRASDIECCSWDSVSYKSVCSPDETNNWNRVHGWWLQRFTEACLACWSVSFPLQSPHGVQPLNMTCPQQLQTTRDILVGKSFWEEREKINVNRKAPMEWTQTDIALTETWPNSNSFVHSHPFPLLHMPLKLRPNSQAALATGSPSRSRLQPVSFPSNHKLISSSLAWTVAGCFALAGILFEECLWHAWPLHMPTGMHPQESHLIPFRKTRSLTPYLATSSVPVRKNRASQPFLNKDQGQSNAL